MSEPSTAFAEPWEARAFAMVRTLRDRGIVTADEWTEALRAAVGGDSAGGVGYRHWLVALEHVLTVKGVVTEDALRSHRDAWRNAARRTAHGDPIALTSTDFHE